MTAPAPYIGSLVTLDAHATYHVNGVPIWECDSTGGRNLSSSGPLAPWMIPGPNVIDVRVHATGPSARVEAQAGLQGDDPFAPLEHQYAWSPDQPTGRLVLDAPDVPRWNWIDADAWNGNDAEIVDLLKRVQQVIRSKDLAALRELLASKIHNAQILYGPLDPQFIEGSMMEVFEAVPELRAPVKVERYHDGRIVSATGAGGGDPLVVPGPDGDMASSLGRWWSRIAGRWQAIG